MQSLYGMPGDEKVKMDQHNDFPTPLSLYSWKKMNRQRKGRCLRENGRPSPYYGSSSGESRLIAGLALLRMSSSHWPSRRREVLAVLAYMGYLSMQPCLCGKECTALVSQKSWQRGPKKCSWPNDPNVLPFPFPPLSERCSSAPSLTWLTWRPTSVSRPLRAACTCVWSPSFYPCARPDAQ